MRSLFPRAYGASTACDGTNEPLVHGACSVCGREVPSRWVGRVATAAVHVSPASASMLEKRSDVWARTQAALCTLIQQGVPTSEAAARLGLTYQKALRLSEPVRPKGHSRARWAPQVRRAALRLLREGIPPTEAAEHVGVPLPTLYRWRIAAADPSA